MKRRRGAIIIIVLVIVMMVSLAGYHFTLSMESEHLATRNAGDQIAARHCALSGVELVASILQQPRDQRDSLSQITDYPLNLWPDQSEDENPYRVTISFPNAGQAGWCDESIKLNLRQLLQWDRESPGFAHCAVAVATNG